MYPLHQVHRPLERRLWSREFLRTRLGLSTSTVATPGQKCSSCRSQPSPSLITAVPRPERKTAVKQEASHQTGTAPRPQHQGREVIVIDGSSEYDSKDLVDSDIPLEKVPLKSSKQMAPDTVDEGRSTKRVRLAVPESSVPRFGDGADQLPSELGRKSPLQQPAFSTLSNVRETTARLGKSVVLSSDTASSLDCSKNPDSSDRQAPAAHMADTLGAISEQTLLPDSTHRTTTAEPQETNGSTIVRPNSTGDLEDWRSAQSMVGQSDSESEAVELSYKV